MRREKKSGAEAPLSLGRKRCLQGQHSNPDIGSGPHQPFDAIAGIGIRLAVSPACHAGPRHVSPTCNTLPGGRSSHSRRAASLPRFRPMLLSHGICHAACPSRGKMSSVTDMPVALLIFCASSGLGRRSPFRMRVMVDGSTSSSRANCEGFLPVTIR